MTENQAESDVFDVPQVIGYANTDVRNEWGVFADRRAKGLGIALLTTCASLQDAERDAANATKPFGDWPLLIAKRTVSRTPWAYAEVFTPPAEFTQCPHEAGRATCVGSCNCPCDPCAPSRQMGRENVGPRSAVSSPGITEQS